MQSKTACCVYPRQELVRPLGYLTFSLMALKEDPVYENVSTGFRGQARRKINCEVSTVRRLHALKCQNNMSCSLNSLEGDIGDYIVGLGLGLGVGVQLSLRGVILGIR